MGHPAQTAGRTRRNVRSRSAPRTDREDPRRPYLGSIRSTPKASAAAIVPPMTCPYTRTSSTSMPTRFNARSWRNRRFGSGQAHVSARDGPTLPCGWIIRSDRQGTAQEPWHTYDAAAKSTVPPRPLHGCATTITRHAYRSGRMTHPTPITPSVWPPGLDR